MSENHFSPSPLTNMEFIKKAAIISSRLPPASAQASKIGINRLPQHHVVVQSDSKQSPSIKEESDGEKYMYDDKLINSNSAKQDRMPDPEDARPSGKSPSVYETVNTVRNGHGNIRSNDMCVQSNVLAARESSCVPRNHMSSYLNASHGADVLDPQERVESRQSGASNESTAMYCGIKVERGVDIYNCVEKREPVLQYYDNASSNGSAVSPVSTNNSHNRLKRICSDEDLTTMRNKKRLGSVYASSNSDDRPDISYGNCRTTYVADNHYPMLTDEFSRYHDVNPQSLMTESPNSSLHSLTSPETGGIDYQQLVADHPTAATSLIMTNPEEERLSDLQDLKDATLLSSDPNPGTVVVTVSTD